MMNNPTYHATVENVEHPVLYFVRERVKYEMIDSTGMRVLAVISEEGRDIQGYQTTVVHGVVFDSIEPDEIGQTMERLKDELEELATDKSKNPTVKFSKYPTDKDLPDLPPIKKELP